MTVKKKGSRTKKTENRTKKKTKKSKELSRGGLEQFWEDVKNIVPGSERKLAKPRTGIRPPSQVPPVVTSPRTGIRPPSQVPPVVTSPRTGIRPPSQLPRSRRADEFVGTGPRGTVAPKHILRDKPSVNPPRPRRKPKKPADQYTLDEMIKQFDRDRLEWQRQERLKNRPERMPPEGQMSPRGRPGQIRPKRFNPHDIEVAGGGSLKRKIKAKKGGGKVISKRHGGMSHVGLSPAEEARTGTMPQVKRRRYMKKGSKVYRNLGGKVTNGNDVTKMIYD